MSGRNGTGIILEIPKIVLKAIRRHAESAYPEECCGVLIGGSQVELGRAGVTTVQASTAVRNVTAGLASNSYQIDPADLIPVLREARRNSREIIGFYHSHPDCAADWSGTDLEEAHWLGCSYLITSVQKGIALQTKSFRLLGESEENKYFEAEELRILEGPDAAGSSTLAELF